MSAVKKVVPMYENEAEQDRKMIISELRKECVEGRGIAKIQAMKLLLELEGQLTPDAPIDNTTITFELAGPIDQRDA